MKTKWIVQKNIWTDDILEMERCFKELDLKYDLIDVIPFCTQTITEPHAYDGPKVAYGSTTLMRLADREWYPGVWYDENTFKPSVWGEKIGVNYLNRGAMILPLREVIDNWKYPKQFIRPDSDFKLFSGAVFRNGDFFDWYTKVKRLIDTRTYTTLTLDTPVSVAEAIPLEAEWRFFIVDKHISACSQYRKDGRLDSSTEYIDFKAIYLAQDIANAKWQLAPAYVVDIAKTKDGEYKVIEFNNFNSSGFYACDLLRIIHDASILAKEQWEGRPND
jgi:hypothetical protein